MIFKTKFISEPHSIVVENVNIEIISYKHLLSFKESFNISFIKNRQIIHKVTWSLTEAHNYVH